MSRNSRCEILFEPLIIGPVPAKTLLYQVPHSNGMGNRYSHAITASRGIKAEGGRAAIATEEFEIHPTSDVSFYMETKQWENSDMDRLALSIDAMPDPTPEAGLTRIGRIGDSLAPSIIAAAVFEGHQYTRCMKRKTICIASPLNV
ncbi:MAG: hypothetical protein WBM41_00585 [Arenicellales bacterium]